MDELDQSWFPMAACRDTDVTIFFRDSTSDEAKAICAECAVEEECLNYAVDTVSQLGVFGRMDAKEREKEFGVHPIRVRFVVN